MGINDHPFVIALREQAHEQRVLRLEERMRIHLTEQQRRTIAELPMPVRDFRVYPNGSVGVELIVQNGFGSALITPDGYMLHSHLESRQCAEGASDDEPEGV